jgi:hypothetical protein
MPQQENPISEGMHQIDRKAASLVNKATAFGDNVKALVEHPIDTIKSRIKDSSAASTASSSSGNSKFSTDKPGDYERRMGFTAIQEHDRAVAARQKKTAKKFPGVS